MNIINTLDKTCVNDIVISKKIENNVLPNSFFYKINYSNEIVTLNGIYILVPFKHSKIDRDESKIKLFLQNDNQEIIRKINNLEDSILNLIKSTKRKTYSLSTQLDKKYIKIYSDYNNSSFFHDSSHKKIMLKISGIWENVDTYGITFKFIYV